VGWIGYYDKGSYQRLAGINPWIAEPTSLLNTRVHELYAGIKGSLLDHISYSAKVGAVQYRNAALFINDSTDGKTFRTVYSPSMQAIKMHGEIAWTQGEDLSWTNAITITHYSKVEGQLSYWGLTPLEISSSLRWQLFKDFFLKGDLYGYGGAPYQSKVGVNTYKSVTGQSGVDVNAGVEFKVTKALNLWLQMNNIFNSKYERWNQYQVYGFNILGGITFSFDQK
jgi:outer membrane receptor for ferrienterochelin and colicin